MQKIKNFLEKIKKRLEFYLVKNTTNLEKLNHIIYRKEHARLNFDLHAIEHGSLLESLVILNKPKTIVELGVAHGSSIKYLCSGAQILDTLIKNDSKFKNTSSEKSSSHIYGFDLWEKHGANNQYERIGSKQEVEKYLNEFGYKNFTLVKCDLNTIEAKNYFNNFKKIDFCYIDACHSYNGVKKNFDLVYPKLSETGIIVFDDTIRIDGAREFIIDLRTKFYDGSFDIITFPFGNRDRKTGVTLLVKRSVEKNNDKFEYQIDEICGSISNKNEIYLKEKNWYKKELKKSDII